MKFKKFVILFTVVLIFIWGNSLIPIVYSADESSRVMRILQKILDLLHINIKLTNHIVRKLAHFTEYTAAGILLEAYMYSANAEKKSFILNRPILSNPIIMGFFIGFIDETLQIFSGRGAMIKDVWIDFSGICFGVFISFSAMKLFGVKKRQNNIKKL